MSQWMSTLTVGKTYKLRYFTKEEFRARVTGETGDTYILSLLDTCSLGLAYEDVSVRKATVKLLEEIAR